MLLLLFNIKHCANSFWLKGWSFFMLDGSYDKQLKYASGALGLMGLKSLKHFYGKKITSTNKNPYTSGLRESSFKGTAPRAHKTTI